MIGQGLGRIAMAEKLSIGQLQEALENRTIPAYIGVPLLEEKIQLEQRMRAAQTNMAPPPQQSIADQVMLQADEVEGGIDQIPVEMDMAGGGIVAFENGGGVDELMAQMTADELALYQQTGQLPVRMQSLAPAPDTGIAPPMPQDQDAISLTAQKDPGLGATAPAQQMFAPLDPKEILAQTDELYSGLYGKGVGAPAPGDKMSYVSRAEDFFKKAGVDLELASKQAADIASQKEALGKSREDAKNMRIIEAGLAIMAGTSPNAFENIGKGATKAMQGFASDIKDLQKTERELADASRKMMQAQNDIRMGVAGAAAQDYDKAAERYSAAAKAQADRKASLAEKIMSNRQSQQIVQAQMQSKSNLDKTTEDVMAMMVAEGKPDNASTRVEARREAAKILGTTQLAGQQQREETAAAERVAKRIKSFTDPKTRLYNAAVKSGNMDLANEIRAEMLDEEMRRPGEGSASSGQVVRQFSDIQ